MAVAGTVSVVVHWKGAGRVQIGRFQPDPSARMEL